MKLNYRRFGLIGTAGKADPQTLLGSMVSTTLARVTPDLIAKAAVETSELASAAAESIVREKNGAIRSCFGIHRQFDGFAKISESRSIVEAASEIAGENLSLYQSHLNLKKARSGGGYSFHRDALYFESRDGLKNIHTVVGVAVAISAINDLMGPLVTLVGTQASYRNDTGTASFQSNNDLRHDDDGDFGIVPAAELETISILGDFTFTTEVAGDLIIYDPRIIHGSGPNLSSRDRAMLLLFYAPKHSFPAEDKTKNPYLHEVSS